MTRTVKKNPRVYKTIEDKYKGRLDNNRNSQGKNSNHLVIFAPETEY